jgi:hypothetical protein
VFMKWIASYSHFEETSGSKMDIMNLATVLAPNVVYAKGCDPTREESLLIIDVVHMLLAHHEVFSAVSRCCGRHKTGYSHLTFTQT